MEETIRYIPIIQGERLLGEIEQAVEASVKRILEAEQGRVHRWGEYMPVLKVTVTVSPAHQSACFH